MSVTNINVTAVVALHHASAERGNMFLPVSTKLYLSGLQIVLEGP